MAKKNELKQQNTTEVFSAQMEKQYKTFRGKIDGALVTADKCRMTIAGALTVIKEKGLYVVAGYETMQEFAEKEFGYKKASLSDLTTTFAKFGNPNTGTVLPEWKDYSFSQLKLMKRLTDENLATVTSDMTARQLQELINSQNALPQNDEAESQNDEAESQNDEAESQNDETVEPQHVEDSGEVQPRKEYAFTTKEWETMTGLKLQTMLGDDLKAGFEVVIRLK